MRTTALLITIMAMLTLSTMDVFAKQVKKRKARTTYNTTATTTVTPKIYDLELLILQAEKYLEESNWDKAKECAQQVLQTEPDNSRATDVLRRAEEEIAARDRREREAYETACRVQTENALRTYLDTYPNGRYVTDVKNRIADLGLWNEAKRKNTQESYENYLVASQSRSFEKEAKAAIENIKEEKDWKQVEHSSSTAALDNFAKKWPNGPHAALARARNYAIQARDCYINDDFNNAASYLRQAENVLENAGQNKRWIYGDSEFVEVATGITDYRAYQTALAANTPDSYSLYISNYSSGRYYNEAVTRRNNALRAIEERRKQQEHDAKMDRWAEWWRTAFSVGWEIFSFDGNYEKDGYDDDLWYLTAGTGLLLRFGHYDGYHNDVASFLFGAKYYYHAYLLNGEFETFGHQVTIPINLRFNLFRTTESGKFYIGGGCEYGWTVSDKSGFMNKNSFSWNAQLGTSSRHFSWALYYKRYLKNKMLVDGIKPDRYGISMTYYF